MRRFWRRLARLWQEAAPEPAPSVELAVGSWRCRCGNLTVGPLTASPGVSAWVSFVCDACGDRGEVLAVPA